MKLLLRARGSGKFYQILIIASGGVVIKHELHFHVDAACCIHLHVACTMTMRCVLITMISFLFYFVCHYVDYLRASPLWFMCVCAHGRLIVCLVHEPCLSIRVFVRVYVSQHTYMSICCPVTPPPLHQSPRR